MFGGCYMFANILCSLYTEMGKPTLKYLGRYTGLNSIFDWIKQPQFIYCLIGLALVGTCRPSCSSSLLAAYKLNETGKLLIF